MAEYNESICRSCLHSYVCEQFNEHRDSYNQKCHFYNDHFVPAADVVQVQHGRWITKQEKDTFAGYLYSYECSECGRVEQCKEPYCNCGAKMDLEG